jgi:hypothetical protein
MTISDLSRGQTGRSMRVTICLHLPPRLYLTPLLYYHGLYRQTLTSSYAIQRLAPSTHYQTFTSQSVHCDMPGSIQWAMYKHTALYQNAITFPFLNFTKCMKTCRYSFLQSWKNWEMTQDYYLQVCNKQIRITLNIPFFCFGYHNLGTQITNW